MSKGEDIVALAARWAEGRLPTMSAARLAKALPSALRLAGARDAPPGGLEQHLAARQLDEAIGERPRGFPPVQLVVAAAEVARRLDPAGVAPHGALLEAPWHTNGAAFEPPSQGLRVLPENAPAAQIPQDAAKVLVVGRRIAPRWRGRVRREAGRCGQWGLALYQGTKGEPSPVHRYESFADLAQRWGEAGGRETHVPAAEALRPTVPVRLCEAREEEGIEDEGEAYVAHRAKWRIEVGGVDAPAHPSALVQSRRLARDARAVPKPRDFALWPGAVRGLSEAQLEAVALAEERFTQRNPDGTRQGFLLGDGTGTGKGRIIATLAGLRWHHPRTASRRAAWLSPSRALLEDARRDAHAVGLDPALVVDAREHEWPEKGIVFATYAQVRGTADRRRLTKWLLDDSDTPFVAWDEAHALRNVGAANEGGASQRSQQATGARALCAEAPNACVLYASATGLENVGSLAYLDRLGLWGGPGGFFASGGELVRALRRTGLGGLELAALDLKSRGVSRTVSLSMRGVDNELRTYALDEESRKVQQRWSGAWQLIEQQWRIHESETPGNRTKTAQGEGSPRYVARAMRLAHLRVRFFRYLLSALKGPRLIEDLEREIAAGNAPVVQLVHTHESLLASHRACFDARAGRVWHPPEPRWILCEELHQHLEALFPVRHRGEKNDEWVEIPGARTTRARALAVLAEERNTPVPLLDQLVLHFGDRLAEVTGRVLRHAHGGGIEERTHEEREREASAFCRGARDVLVFTAAGASGRSYHATRALEDRRRRVHFVLETATSARQLVQGLGRTHRAHQWSAPRVVNVMTDLPAEQRFRSRAIRRLAQLGAASRGDRKGLRGAVPDEVTPDFESLSARQAMARLTARIGRDREEDERWQKWLGTRVSTLNAAGLWTRLVQLSPDNQATVADAFAREYRATYANNERLDRIDRGIEDWHVQDAKWVGRTWLHGTGVSCETRWLRHRRPVHAKTNQERLNYCQTIEAQGACLTSPRVPDGYAVRIAGDQGWVKVGPMGIVHLPTGDLARNWHGVHDANEVVRVHARVYDAGQATWGTTYRPYWTHVVLIGDALAVLGLLEGKGRVRRLVVPGGSRPILAVVAEVPDYLRAARALASDTESKEIRE